ncbi:MAG: hypothetical protein KGJ58_03415 [Patescibacteria group bacterium]|nr:hypothetical protein [Patescibacteria group bacterium]MDE2218471.1 hypothetical protein [Patescibacteria group bacterium]
MLSTFQKSLSLRSPNSEKSSNYLDAFSEKIGKVKDMQEQTGKELKELEKSVLKEAFVL